jgi:hypothetical protein
VGTNTKPSGITSSRPQTSTKPTPLHKPTKAQAPVTKKAPVNKPNEDISQTIKSPKQPLEKQINFEYLMSIVNNDD